MSTAGVVDSGQIWFNSEQAATYTGSHVQTVLKAAGAGELHGSQRTSPHGRWRFHRACLDAWAIGQACAHQPRLRLLAETG